MKHATLRLIKDEHRSLAAVLQAAEQVVTKANAAGRTPDFSLLRAILYYVREFPERRHHPHEDQVLFARIKAATQEADAVIAELQNEHGQGEERLSTLTKALEDWEAGDKDAGKRFAANLAGFTAFYLAHMQKEEQRVLPVAEQALSSEDWHAIHAAFESNHDPLFANDTAGAFRSLYSRIMQFASQSASAVQN